MLLAMQSAPKTQLQELADLSLSRLQGDMRKECEMGSLGSSVLLCDGVADLGPGSALSLSMLGFDSDKLHHLQTQALSPSSEQFLKAQ
ncbi:hypothetical protein HaLaN_28209, partial [Haematococcus lacustris]